MTNDLTIPESGPVLDLSRVPTDDLKKQLAESIGVTARTLSQMAAIWTELESRGEDLSALRGGLMSYLPLIAEGRLDPELVVRAAGQATLLKAASALSIADQRDLLENGLPVFDVDKEGQFVERRVPVENVGMMEIRRAIAADHIRTPAEQARLAAPARDRKDRRGVIVKVRLTQEQYDGLKRRAAADGRRVPTYARTLLTGEAE